MIRPGITEWAIGLFSRYGSLLRFNFKIVGNDNKWRQKSYFKQEFLKRSNL